MPDQLHVSEDVRHVPHDLLDKSPEIMTETERIEAVLKVAAAYGGIDGGHHKMWTIDQIIRVLTGSPLDKSEVHTNARGSRYTYDSLGQSSAYMTFVADYNNGEDGENTYFWGSGIAP